MAAAADAEIEVRRRCWYQSPGRNLADDRGGAQPAHTSMGRHLVVRLAPNSCLEVPCFDGGKDERGDENHSAEVWRQKDAVERLKYVGRDVRAEERRTTVGWGRTQLFRTRVCYENYCRRRDGEAEHG